MNILKSTITKLGNKIELIGTPSDNNILIIGVFHGDEPQGKYLIKEYLNRETQNTPTSNSPLSLPLSHKGRGLQSKNLLKFAKELRTNATDAEQRLWNVVRGNKLNGLHFKRQQPIGKYIVDFVCFAKKIIIELDGGGHNEDSQINKDNERTKYLNSQGFKVIRVWNNEVLTNLEGTIEFILSSLAPCGRGVGRGGNSLLFIPCLNPDGMSANTRVNANNVDLNRNFPTKNWGKNEGDNATCDDETTAYFGGKSPASEIETKFVIDIIEKYQPKLILTLHAPYKVVNYDGPAKKIAEKISQIINYPTEGSIGYPTPGSFGTYCGVERNIPTITLELDEEIQVQELVEPVFKIFDLLSITD